MDITKQNNHIAAEVPGKLPAYWLTRFVILRLLGVIYAIAFLIAINQLIPLIGSHGLTPVNLYLDRIARSFGSTAAGFWRLPSLFWFSATDEMLIAVSWIGFILSCLVAIGYANAITLFILWFLYLSIVHAGQLWYGYGWEIQLTETGFLAIFLCPLLDPRPFPRYAPPMPIIILFRWLLFRIMLGAGLIKIRGDKIWRDASALYYHFETQPMPGPLSRWFHFLPLKVLKAGVWFNHLGELVAPWFVFWPRKARHIAGVIIILFQFSIILSGNLSFLNWLTIIPALACLDDGFWQRILPKKLVRIANNAAENAAISKPMRHTAWVITVIIVILSIRPAVNLLSPAQIMNTSFDPFDLVNTYGAFGTVGKERLNLVIEGTADRDSTNKAHWKPYIYKGLPVIPDRRPPQIAPYQLRLDWQLWFAAMATPEDYPWTIHLTWKLLHNDKTTLDLFAANPFPGKPPKYVRVILYRYSFVKTRTSKNLYWKRDRIKTWLPARSVNNQQLIKILQREEWIR